MTIASDRLSHSARQIEGLRTLQDIRNLQSVEDPSDPEPNDHEKVKTAQGQSVEAERDIRLNNSWRENRTLALQAFHSRRS